MTWSLRALFAVCAVPLSIVSACAEIAWDKGDPVPSVVESVKSAVVGLRAWTSAGDSAGPQSADCSGAVVPTGRQADQCTSASLAPLPLAPLDDPHLIRHEHAVVAAPIALPAVAVVVPSVAVPSFAAAPRFAALAAVPAGFAFAASWMPPAVFFSRFSLPTVEAAHFW
jgi:hypothetical protein